MEVFNSDDGNPKPIVFTSDGILIPIKEYTGSGEAILQLLDEFFGKLYKFSVHAILMKIHSSF